MRKIERRAFICLLIAFVLFSGLLVFMYRFVRYGGEWATFYGNQSIYSGDALASGTIFDRNGEELARNADGTTYYSDDYYVRLGTVHAVGDSRGNVATAALSNYREKLIGYNLVTGTYKLKGKNPDITLTIDSDASRVAAEYLSYYDGGAVGVYNYKTGEVLCMASGPSYDPTDIPELEPDDTSGIFINRLLTANMTPGSIFKTVTAAAAIENMDYRNFHFICEGELEIGDDKVTCQEVHGEVNFETALTKSCNVAYAVMAQELGAETLVKYTEKAGLTSIYDMDGIKNIAGEFEFPSDNKLLLSWAAIGQHNDELNPLSMMVYMGAIANGGKAAMPRMLSRSFLDQIPITVSMTDELITPETSYILKEMMLNNVRNSYGEGNFPGLNMGAKTGTAEVMDREPNAVFAGFLDDKDHPYAFIVYVENAGNGIVHAAPIANAVLQTLMD